jgi:TRAP-type mannitol/chloroaromatic compound transport system permease large subunit
MVIKSLVPPMILIMGVLGSIFMGVATPTEAAGVGAILAFLMTVAYGKFTWKGLISGAWSIRPEPPPWWS